MRPFMQEQRLRNRLEAVPKREGEAPAQRRFAVSSARQEPRPPEMRFWKTL